jgi:hypothetical protein
MAVKPFLPQVGKVGIGWSAFFNKSDDLPSSYFHKSLQSLPLRSNG